MDITDAKQVARHEAERITAVDTQCITGIGSINDRMLILDVGSLVPRSRH